MAFIGDCNDYKNNDQFQFSIESYKIFILTTVQPNYDYSTIRFV